MPVVSLSRARLAYGHQPLLDGADFQLAAGERVGLIRFGSRVDVYLPQGTAPQVLLGQRTLAGETIVARLGKGDTIDGIGQ